MEELFPEESEIFSEQQLNDCRDVNGEKNKVSA